MIAPEEAVTKPEVREIKREIRERFERDSSKRMWVRVAFAAVVMTSVVALVVRSRSRRARR